MSRVVELFHAQLKAYIHSSLKQAIKWQVCLLFLAVKNSSLSKSDGSATLVDFTVVVTLPVPVLVSLESEKSMLAIGS